MPNAFLSSRRIARVAAGLSLALGLSLAAMAQTPVATVTVQTAPLGRLIPQDMIGFSLEVSAAGQGLPNAPRTADGAATVNSPANIVYALGEPGQPNLGYAHFLGNLGKGLLRLGGNSQDNTCWDAKSAPLPKFCQGEITPAQLRLWATASRISGWPLTIGINLKQNNPQWALKEVTEGIAREIPAKDIVALEIGNEPVLFTRDGGRPKPYTTVQQASDFLRYADAFAKNPVARQFKLMGPDNFGWNLKPAELGQWTDLVGPHRLAMVTTHMYAKTVCNNHTFTMQSLLGKPLADRWAKLSRAWVEAAEQRGVPLALDETNSASCGGMPGVSNAFASTVWGLDWMFMSAQSGMRYVDFHTSYRAGGSSYNPVDTYGHKDARGHWTYTNVTEPLYYGMYLFAHHAEGANLLNTAIETPANIRAYAVSRCAGCAVDVFLINKDLQAAGAVKIALAGQQGTPAPARVLEVSAPHLSSLAAEVRYGGRQFDNDGRIGQPTWRTVQPDSDGSYTVTLPNAAVLLVEVPAAK